MLYFPAKQKFSFKLLLTLPAYMCRLARSAAFFALRHHFHQHHLLSTVKGSSIISTETLLARVLTIPI